MLTQAHANLKEYRNTGNYLHMATYCTPGFLGLTDVQRTAALSAFHKAPEGDHLYVIEMNDNIKIYFAENGAGYTAMLPNEY